MKSLFTYILLCCFVLCKANITLADQSRVTAYAKSGVVVNGQNAVTAVAEPGFIAGEYLAEENDENEDEYSNGYRKTIAVDATGNYAGIASNTLIHTFFYNTSFHRHFAYSKAGMYIFIRTIKV